METPIYEGMVAHARERGSTIPDGTPESLAWATPVTYGGYRDWPSPRPRLVPPAAVQDEGAPN